jgi:hypothetical protein
MRFRRSLHVKYPTKLARAKTSITPHVAQKSGQGIPKLLPYPGDNPQAMRTHTHAKFPASFVSFTLQAELVFSDVFMLQGD